MFPDAAPLGSGLCLLCLDIVTVTEPCVSVVKGSIGNEGEAGFFAQYFSSLVFA